jgi:hypothetical protein
MDQGKGFICNLGVITMNKDRLYVHYLFRKTTDKTLTSVEEFRDEYTKAYARVPSGDIGGSMITSVGGKVAAAVESSLPLKSCRIFLADVGEKLMETNKETITGICWLNYLMLHLIYTK